MRPPVVVTQGTQDVDPADLIEPSLKGLADLEVEVIATSGRRGQTDVGVAPPANARVVDLIDFASVLPKAAVFVTNGGWGGVLASLAAGVPLGGCSRERRRQAGDRRPNRALWRWHQRA
ncbi:MAG TPA: nucleotide disphospho-sugar-binding domain-containing protein [Propionibacteriaceae bacterium]